MEWYDCCEDGSIAASEFYTVMCMCTTCSVHTEDSAYHIHTPKYSIPYTML